MKCTDYKRTLNMLRKDSLLYIEYGVAGGGLGKCKDITVYFDKSKTDRKVYFLFDPKGNFILMQ